MQHLLYRNSNLPIQILHLRESLWTVLITLSNVSRHHRISSLLVSVVWNSSCSCLWWNSTTGSSYLIFFFVNTSYFWISTIPSKFRLHPVLFPNLLSINRLKIYFFDDIFLVHFPNNYCLFLLTWVRKNSYKNGNWLTVFVSDRFNDEEVVQMQACILSLYSHLLYLIHI